MRVHPILRFARMHKGIDFGAALGHARSSPPPTARSARAGWAGGYGRQVRIAHGGGMATSYSHMSRMVVEPGSIVRQGQVIGYVGSSGLSTGPHLHYEVYRGGVAVNPLSVRFAGAGGARHQGARRSRRPGSAACLARARKAPDSKHLFTLMRAKSARENDHDDMKPRFARTGQPERRRAERAALRLNATMRTGAARAGQGPADRHFDPRLPDRMHLRPSPTTAGSGSASPASRRNIAGSSGTARSSSAWNSKRRCPKRCSSGCCRTSKQLPETAIKESARHRQPHPLAGAQGGRRRTSHILAELSRKCAVDAVVEGLPPAASARTPPANGPAPKAASARRAPQAASRLSAQDPADPARLLDPLRQASRAADPA